MSHFRTFFAWSFSYWVVFIAGILFVNFGMYADTKNYVSHKAFGVYSLFVEEPDLTAWDKFKGAINPFDGK